MKEKITLGVLAASAGQGAGKRAGWARDADMIELAAVDASANEYRITRGGSSALQVSLRCVDGTDTRWRTGLNRLHGKGCEKDFSAREA